MKALLIVVLFSLPAQAQVSRITLYGAAGLDLESTWLGMHPGVRESNPLLGQSKVRQTSVLLSLTALTDFETRRMERKKLATVIRLVTVGVHIAAAGWNTGRK